MITKARQAITAGRIMYFSGGAIIIGSIFVSEEEPLGAAVLAILGVMMFGAGLVSMHEERYHR